MHKEVLKEILEERLPPRKLRKIPRAVKRRVSHYPARPKNYNSRGLIIKPKIRMVTK
jgi:hypothetical protein